MLVIDNLGMTNADGAEVLRGITLDIEAGETVAVVGGPRLGRTALLRLIAGLERPGTGRVALSGRPLDPAEVGMVYPQPRLLSWLPVADNVGVALSALAVGERAARIDDALRRLGLSALAGRRPADLPAATAQRVAIARALAPRPRVLLLDDPFSAFEARDRMDLQDDLIDLFPDGRPATVIATRDVEEAALLADRVVVLRSRPGRIARVIEQAEGHGRNSRGLEVAKRRVSRLIDRLPVVPVVPVRAVA